MTEDSLDALSALLSGSADLLDIPPETRDAAVDKYTDVGHYQRPTARSLHLHCRQ